MTESLKVHVKVGRCHDEDASQRHRARRHLSRSAELQRYASGAEWQCPFESDVDGELYGQVKLGR